MFFWEILAFALVFPTCWWLGGRMSREAPPKPKDNVVDLADWRRRHSQRPHNRATR